MIHYRNETDDHIWFLARSEMDADPFICHVGVVAEGESVTTGQAHLETFNSFTALAVRSSEMPVECEIDSLAEYLNLSPGDA